MKRMTGNLLRSILYIGIAGFIGYHVHETQGVMGVGINAIFLVLGLLMFATWQSGKSKAQKMLDAQSLEEKKLPITIVERPINIVKECFSEKEPEPESETVLNG